MKLVKKILSKFNGLHYPQEYLCIAKESFQQPLRVYLVDGGKIIKDITDEHLFTGYSPLIITLYSPIGEQLSDNIDIIYSQRLLQPNDLFKQKDAIARLSLKRIRTQMAGNIAITYYEGIKGEHHFVSSFHQFMISLNNRLYNKKPGNVFLNNKLYKQVQIAYAFPRLISLITLRDDNLYNLFPTDLHGSINNEYYVGSLRHEGKACKQVEAAKRMVISEMNCNGYKMVYGLGKNHMQPLRSKDYFPFGESNSTVYQLPLPQSVLAYRELELLESFVHGIHKLFLYKIVSRQVISNESATLAQIHNVYATWRRNKGLPGNYLLR